MPPLLSSSPSRNLGRWLVETYLGERIYPGCDIFGQMQRGIFPRIAAIQPFGMGKIRIRCIQYVKELEN